MLPPLTHILDFAMGCITVGVLALQGAFYEHIQLLKSAAADLPAKDRSSASQWDFIEVRTPQELERCDALVLPGGESTTMALVAARSNLLEPLRDFVKYVWSIFRIICLWFILIGIQGPPEAYLGYLRRSDPPR